MTKAKTMNRPTTDGMGPATAASDREVKATRRQRSDAGKAAKLDLASTDTSPPKPAITTTTPTPKPARQTKAALLRSRLSEPDGVSLTTLIEATGWQAHTLRAALSGLRKEGLTLIRRRDGKDTIYAIETRSSEASPPVKSDA